MYTIDDIYFVQVIWKQLYSCSSSSDHGTLYQLRNLINRRNVVVDPKRDVNACEDFFVLTVKCYIIAAVMKELQMNSLDDIPSDDVVPEDTWLLPDDEKERVLTDVCDKILEQFCTIKYHTTPTISLGDNDQQDQILLYASEVLTLGLLYLEFVDAIKEGDGTRIIRCYRYFLPLLRHSQRTNYSNEVLLMLYQLEFLLTPRQAQQLIWSQTVNYVGLPGHNVPCDMHLEHMNRLCKEMIKGLGANKTEESIIRIGKCQGPVKTILENFDKVNNVQVGSGSHSYKNDEKDGVAIIKHLLKSKVFHFLGERKHKAFKSLKTPITKAIKQKNLEKWMTDRLEHYALLNINEN